MDVHSISTHCSRTEFVGTAVLDTIRLVISGNDDTLLKQMQIGLELLIAMGSYPKIPGTPYL